ncbi:uncharacterized protein LOC123010157 [Tribolium madens]|uniref:uncharacterized protein LOC123010157 n=1 Tax=Tribolium madens TaxID=41895 RepID=UPI001CF74B19|nr:uncharacterized protein LOC123010157 [Tribolium madens]
MPVGMIKAIWKLLYNKKIPKCQYFFEEVIPRYDFSTFRSHFRITRTSFEAILNHIANAPELNRKDPLLYGGMPQIPVEKMLLAALWTLANPECYRPIGDRFNITKSTVFMCVHKIVDVILVHLCKLFIKWPTVNERNAISQNFARFGVPNVIDVVDGCHIPIKKPTPHGVDYFNKNFFYSVVLQGICTSNLMFTDVDCRWPGSVHDARIFRTSDIQGQVADPDLKPSSRYPKREHLDHVTSPDRR